MSSIAALLAAACTPVSGIDPVSMLRRATFPQWAHGASGSSRALGIGHPMITAVAPAGLLSTQARHLPAAASGPSCDATQPRGAAAPYTGGSASALYDRLFSPDAQIPYLATHIPKAVRNWPNWDGQGHDLILLGMYRFGHPSYLVGMDPASGRLLGTVAIKESHLAGMDFLRDWLFTQDDAPRTPLNHHPKVRRYRIDALREAMQRAVSSGRQVYLDTDGPADPIDAIDFFTVDGDSIYAGNHGSSPVPGRMYRYALTPDGHLRKVEGPWTIPMRVQGLVITPDDFIFSTNNDVGRGSLFVVRRATPEATKAPIACVWMPALPENMTVHDGQLLLSYEGGSPRFDRDHPVNRITHLHSASLQGLLSTLDPVAVAAERALGIAPADPGPAVPAPSVPAPSVPAPNLPLPNGAGATIPLPPGIPAPSVPALTALPAVGGLLNPSRPMPGTGATIAPQPAPAPTPTTDAAPPDLVLRAPVTTPVPPAGAAPDLELWLPTRRVSDALDFYSRELDRTGAPVDSKMRGVVGSTATPVPVTVADPTAAAVADAAPTPAVDPTPATAAEAAPAAGGVTGPARLPASHIGPAVSSPQNTAPTPLSGPLREPARGAAGIGEPEAWPGSDRISDAYDYWSTREHRTAVPDEPVGPASVVRAPRRAPAASRLHRARAAELWMPTERKSAAFDSWLSRHPQS